ncbi:MAG: hypothetical protein IKB04_01130 [Clostridia bacterium]|nr:hypothetical protein [Clostridia bacterium]
MKLLCRAARYAGRKRLSNALFDLLDFATEAHSHFDMKNRVQLLQTLGIDEGKDSLGKAEANITLYEALRTYTA